MGVRAERRQQMEHRLHRVAMELVVAEGVDGLSMHALARALGVTPGALYRYVDSREALLAQLLVAVVEDFSRVVGTAMQGGADPVKAVVRAAGGFTWLSMTAPQRFGLLAVVMAEPRVLVPAADQAEPVMQALLLGLAPVAQGLDAAAESGALRPGVGADRALLLFTSLVGVLALRKQQRHGLQALSVDSLAEELVGTLMRGWGAQGCPSVFDELDEAALAAALEA